MFDDEVAYQGTEVAFVLAEDERIAEDALALIEVEYKELPFVHDLDAAMADGAAPALLEEANLIQPDGQVYARGEVERGLQEAGVVVGLTFTTPVAAHCCMETHGSAAWWEGDQVTVWHSTQGVFGARSSVAEMLDIPQAPGACDLRVRWRGVWEQVGGRELYLDGRSGGTPDGAPGQGSPGSRRGTLIEHEAWVVTGAYGGGGSIIGGPAKDLYDCPNVRTVVWALRANTDAGRAFRAPGYVEGTFALEGAMDELAQELGIDPLDLRLKNYAEMSPSRDPLYTV